MHDEVFAKNTKALFLQLGSIKSISNFYLSGGTGLALHLGHRESEDLDFFSEHDFVATLLQNDLSKLGEVTDIYSDSGTLNCRIQNVKLQFLKYQYRLLERPVLYENINISSVPDIACTKLITISDRGSKKDFIDLYFILMHHHSLHDLFTKLNEKYQKVKYNKAHIVKSLVYFDDADAQPMPRMHIPVKWDDVKLHIEKEVGRIDF